MRTKVRALLLNGMAVIQGQISSDVCGERRRLFDRLCACCGLMGEAVTALTLAVESGDRMAIASAVVELQMIRQEMRYIRGDLYLHRDKWHW